MKSGSILIIDDEPLMRVSMVDALQAVGYEVQEASTGLEGLERLQASEFNLVITDLRLPGADGLQIVSQCKEQWPNTEVIGSKKTTSIFTSTMIVKRII